MTDIQLYTKISALPLVLKNEVVDFIEFLKYKSQGKTQPQKRLTGLAKGLIVIKDNFDDPIDGFKEYVQ